MDWTFKPFTSLGCLAVYLLVYGLKGGRHFGATAVGWAGGMVVGCLISVLLQRLKVRRWWREVCRPLCESCSEPATHQARILGGIGGCHHFCRFHAGVDL